MSRELRALSFVSNLYLLSFRNNFSLCFSVYSLCFSVVNSFLFFTTEYTEQAQSTAEYYSNPFFNRFIPFTNFVTLKFNNKPSLHPDNFK